jgi:hypothetical protein
VSIVAALVLGAWAGRLVGGGWVLGFALVLSLGLVLSATVTPGLDALSGIGGSGVCDLRRVGPPPLADLVWPREALLNILLFVPLGVVIGLCPPTRARTVLAAGAIGLPFAIELVQMQVERLGRQCQSADVVDNLIGLGVGLALALLLRAVTGPVRRAGRSEAGG